MNELQLIEKELRAEMVRLSRIELVKFAVAMGVDPDPTATKAEIMDECIVTEQNCFVS